MKKLISILLVLTMVVLMVPVASIAVFAETETLNNVGNSSQDITATYVAGETSTIYAIEISWGSLAFTYTAAGQGTWDPDSLAYTGTSEAAWTCAQGANEVTVTNRSNVAVVATITDAVDSTNGLNVSFSWDDESLELESAVGKPANELPTATAALTVTGAIAATDTVVTIGRVTVTITDAPAQQG